MGAHSQTVQHGVHFVKNNNNSTTTTKPADIVTEATYSSLIQQYLSVFLVDNATFLAERLVASTKSSHAHYLLALCHYRNGQPKRTKCILEARELLLPEMQYLLAKACMDLGEYGQAEEALLEQVRIQFRQARTEHDKLDMDEWILNSTPCPVPNGAAGLYLMGEICKRSNRRERAKHYFRLSLKLDPIMWSSYEALCEMGAEDDPTQVFGVCPTTLQTACSEGATVTNNAASTTLPIQERGVLTPSFSLSQTPLDVVARPMETTPANASSSRLPKTSLFATTSRISTSLLFETPNLTPILKEKSFHAATTNPRVVIRARKVAARLYYPPSPETPMSGIHTKSLFLSGLQEEEEEGTPKDAKISMGQTNMTFSATASNKSTTRSLLQPQQEHQLEPEMEQDAIKREDTVNEEQEEGGGVQEILELLCVLGAAHRHLCQYRCREALQIFHRLPHEQFHTGWVLHQVGRAYFEMNDYQNARRHLELMQQFEPHRIKGLEILSTTLWQLKKEVELSHLAQRAVDFDRKTPECWCIVGNCFSLQKEHETALTFFRRAIQLDPTFTYPHTLSGHEYSAIEDFDKAVSCYRDAIRADERHYNAWYGLGAVYYRQEKYDLAEYHFQRALAINTKSSVLHCHVGMAQHANGKPYQALDTLAAAFRLDPINPQGRYQRATIYMAMDRPHEALMELEKVRDAAPREASIHFAMGRVLKRIGRPEQAMRCFLIALDLDPKDANVIKAAMEKMDEPDIDEASAF